MKQLTTLFLFLIIGFSVIKTSNAQIVTLEVNQNYELPETPTIIQDGDTLQSSAIYGNQWFKDGDEIEGETDQIMVIDSSGSYMVTVTDSSTGCSSYSKTIFVVKTAVSLIESEAFSCRVYPNPNNGLFTVEVESDKTGPVELKLFSINGKLLLSEQASHTPGEQQLQFGNNILMEGIYTLQINFAGKTKSHKLIVNQ